jgi:RHS repeat-associated protein
MGGIDEYFTRTDSSGTSNFLTDALGSTVALTDASGTVQTQYTYDPFGSTTISGASTANSFAYTGREIDPAGLYFSRARYYDPAIGRFISEDPARLSGGSVNFYAYANANPISYSDPFGLQSTAGRGSCPPKCFAQLKFRPVDDWRAKQIGATHSFWYVQGSSGTQYIISGGPWPENGSKQNLDVWKNSNINAKPDNVSATTSWQSGLSADNCKGVDALIKTATNWPENTIPYNWRGPNSNSAARSLGIAGGFNPPAPSGSVGWDTPIP